MTKSRTGGWLRFILRLVVSAGLIALLLSRVEWSELRDLATRLRPLWLLPIFCGMFATTVLSSWKWSVFLRADGISIGLRTLVARYLTSTFFSCFLPSSIGGDVYRVYTVGKTAGASKSTAAVMMGRLTGFFTLAAIGLVAAIFSHRLIDDSRILASIAGVLVLIVAAFVAICSRRVLRLFQWSMEGIGLGRVGHFADDVQESVLRYRRRPGVLAGALAISVIQQLTVLVSIYLLSRVLALEISFVYFLAFVPVIEAAAAIPISVFGLGVRDAGYVLYFGAVGLARAECLGISLLYVSVTLIYSSLGGISYLASRVGCDEPPAAIPSPQGSREAPGRQEPARDEIH